MSLKILQSSDWHFGAPVIPPSYEFDDSVIRLREDEEKSILDRIVSLAKERQVDLVLLPGDLWDVEIIQFAKVKRIIEALGSLAPIPVVIVPGNHDFLSSSSPYNEKVAGIHGVVWPHNVTIITSRQFEVINLPSLAGVSITAQATGANVPVSDRMLQERLTRGTEDINFLVFHGSRESGAHFSSSDKLITAPFSDDELIQQEFSYTALGHYHSHGRISSPEGKIIGAYSGAPFQRDFKSQGENGVIICDIDNDGVIDGSFELIPVDDRKLCSIKVNLTGAVDDNVVRQRLIDKLNDSHCNESDIARIRLEGAYSRGAYWQPEFDLQDKVFACTMEKSGLSPAFNLAEAVKDSPAGSAQGVFLRRFADMIADLKNEAEPDMKKIRNLELAAFMGYEAFQGNKPLLVPDMMDGGAANNGY